MGLKNDSVIKTRKKYQSKLKHKQVVFYLHELDLYEFARSINFQKFVKEKLEEERRRQGGNL